MRARIKVWNTSLGVASYALGLTLLASGVAAQTGKDLIGTWTVVSVTADRDGTKVETYGPDPKGILTFSENGRYTSILTRSDLAKFASNNRMTGTPDENKAVVQGTNAHFGSYTVEAGSITFRIDAATFPNWNGVEQKRPFTISGDEPRISVPASSSGGTAELIYKRTK